eukprot:jgi/Bigna1/72519/fgenesh1_pg.20_\
MLSKGMGVGLNRVALILAATVVTASFPMPERTTANQGATLRVKGAIAQNLSIAAEGKVKEFLSSEEMNEVFQRCCPLMVPLNGEERLAVLHTLVMGSELVHNFPSVDGTGNFFKDLTIKLAMEYPWFLNEWQALLILNGTTGSKDAKNTSNRVYVDAEVSIYGCKAFAKEQHPTWEEASDRLLYVAHNMRQIDTGNNVFFGNVSAVFRTSKVKDNVLIAPIDTGIYEGSCNNSYGPNLPIDCDAWKDDPIGTLEFSDHLFLENLQIWAKARNYTMVQEAEALFTRSAISKYSYSSLPNVTSKDVIRYYESNIVGNPPFPESVKFLIGYFPYLFGTQDGLNLQKLADRYNWPLVWALGVYPTSHHISPAYGANERVLDPTAKASSSLNITISKKMSASFEELWGKAAAVRKSTAHKLPPQTTIEGWWSELMQTEQVRIGPASPFSCRALDECIGVSLSSNDCICL